jgi:hypothetical protein
MELQFWIYVIIGIIYVLSRAIKKQEKQNKEVVQDYRPGKKVEFDSTPPAEKPKQLTFEELLKEITEAKKQAQKPVFETKRSYETVSEPQEYVDYDDQLEEEEKDLEDVNYNYRKKDKLYDIYEEAKRQAFERPSLEETMKVTDTKVQFGKFKVFEQVDQTNLLEEYSKEFQDAEGLRKAVVLSEILNRKF